jgi:hypothetical protein
MGIKMLYSQTAPQYIDGGMLEVVKLFKLYSDFVTTIKTSQVQLDRLAET